MDFKNKYYKYKAQYLMLLSQKGGGKKCDRCGRNNDESCNYCCHCGNRIIKLSEEGACGGAGCKSDVSPRISSLSAVASRKGAVYHLPVMTTSENPYLKHSIDEFKYFKLSFLTIYFPEHIIKFFDTLNKDEHDMLFNLAIYNKKRGLALGGVKISQIKEIENELVQVYNNYYNLVVLKLVGEPSEILKERRLKTVFSSANFFKDEKKYQS
jgi:hypothetical protein